MRYLTAGLALAVSLTATASGWARDFSFLLDAESTGALQFRKKHPDWDGRGIVVAVLDTGVDMAVPGLQHTTTGKVKVIDARDFTNEGLVDCEPGNWEKDHEEGLVLRSPEGYLRLPERSRLPRDQLIYLCFLKEERFRDAALRDLNANGRTDDVFGAAVFKRNGEWVAVVDVDGDHNLMGHTPRRSYRFDPTPLFFTGHDPKREMSPAGVALTIHPPCETDGSPRLEFHVPSGGHATHVAAIAAGHGIAAVKGYDGLAPGAQVLSLKIGNNGLSGGATVTESMKKALDFAAKYSDRHDVFVVANMSYGVGSELEGQADIERYIDRLLHEHRRLLVVVSAGNSGPGLSTVGSPAAAYWAVTAAAALTPVNARAIMEAPLLETPRLFSFSARGGELAKPDIATPGIASSEVPYYEKHDVMMGTSMAAPQATGAIALVLSATDLALEKVNAGVVKRAVVHSGRRLKGLHPYDSVGGFLSIPDLHRELKRLLTKGYSGFMGYRVSVDCPSHPTKKGTAVFVRTGGFVPDRDTPLEATIWPEFTKSAEARSIAHFTDVLRLESDAPWVRLTLDAARIRAKRKAKFGIYFDRRRLSTPGIHTATITATGRTGRIELPVTVVVPVKPRLEDGIPSFELQGVTLRPARLHRVPFMVSPHYSAAALRVRPSRGARAAIYVYVYDQEGHPVELRSRVVWSTDGRKIDTLLAPPDLPDHGTLEMDLYAVPKVAYESKVDVSLRFYDLRAPKITRFRSSPGEPPFATIAVTNRMLVPFVGRATGVIRGYDRVIRKNLKGDRAKHSIEVGPAIARVEVLLEMSRRDWAKFTDVAVLVRSPKGKTILKAAFNRRRLRLAWNTSEKGTYTMEIVGGRTYRGSDPVQLKVVETYLWDDPVRLVGSVKGQRRFSIFPECSARVRVESTASVPSKPGGTLYTGFVELVSARDQAPWARIPIEAR